MPSCHTTRAQGVGGVLGVGVLLVVLGARSAAAASCPVPSSAYPTIQAAVDHVTCGTIHVAAGTYTEHVVISRAVTIRGEGQERTIIDGSQGIGVVLRILSGVVTIKKVTIQHGFSAFGGGIYNQGRLTIQDSTIANNGAHFLGGGIYNDHGTLTIQDSTIANNTVGDDGGGGIFNDGTLTIQDSTIANNRSFVGDGGGIRNHGRLTIQDSTIADNSTPRDGGGIFNFNTGRLTIQDSTITDNSASHDGGGIFNLGSVTLSDVSLQDNTPNDCTGCP